MTHWMDLQRQFSSFFYSYEVLRNPSQSIDANLSLPGWVESVPGVMSFMASFSGCAFNESIYRIHDLAYVNDWNKRVGEAFANFKDRVFCFGYDWLGRNFALDKGRISQGEPLILMLDPGANEVLEIPVNFTDFHNLELVEYQDAALASAFFDEWKKKSRSKVNISECVGYKVPLFLDGEDRVENLEIIDMIVYWDICGQLIKDALALPVGATIKQVSLGRS